MGARAWRPGGGDAAVGSLYTDRKLLPVRSALRSLLGTRPESRGFAFAVALAFLPAALLGLAFHETIKEKLFAPIPVGIALIGGAIAILVVEGLPLSRKIERAEDAGWRRGLAVGFAQCLALWPGFSRSAATILGGMGAGLNRKAATEFSLFLAIPTMFAATLWDLSQNHQHLEPGDASAYEFFCKCPVRCAQ